ncbi:MAG: hypothetical protein SFW35_07975 [Chitinophagales bacterium]|nr:hypothetical protein [Chitinophagales bacterium]
MTEPIDIPEAEKEVKPVPSRKGVLHTLAVVISYVFHPLFMTLYIFFFIDKGYPFLFAHLGRVAYMQVVVVLVTNTVIYPLVTILLMKQLGFANSLQLRTQRERIIPYIAMSVFYFWTFMVIRNLAIGELFNKIMLGGAISIFMAFFLNNFYKISIHSVAAGNFVAVALVVTLLSNYNMEWAFASVMLLAGLIGSARLYLKAHRSRDIYSGYMIGVLSQMIAYRYLLN